MRSVKLIIFDLDGTLIEFPHDFIFAETERILPILDHPEIARTELAEHFSSFDYFRFVRVPERESFIARFWKEFNWALHPKPVPFSWTAATLEALAGARIPMAIATARLDSEHSIRADLERTGWLHHFSCVRARQAADVSWTDKTEQLNYICRTMHIEPCDAFVIGDIPSDIESAKTVGIGHTAAVLSGGIKRSVLEASGPDYLLSSIEDLLHLLDKSPA